MKLCKKQKFLASRLQRPGVTSSLKKLLADCFKTLADGPKTGLLAACAISTGASQKTCFSFIKAFWKSDFTRHYDFSEMQSRVNKSHSPKYSHACYALKKSHCTHDLVDNCHVFLSGQA